MKKLSSLILIFVLFQPFLFAQLNIIQGVSSSEHIFDSRDGNLLWDNSGFIYVACDDISSLTVSIALGKDKQSAILSLTQIRDWFYAANKKDAIIINNSSDSITVIKYSSTTMVISTDNATTAEKEYTRRDEVVLTVAMVGLYLPGSASNDVPMISNLTVSNLKKMIKAVQKLDNPKYIAGDPMLDEAYIKKQKRDVAIRYIDSLKVVLREARSNKDEVQTAAIIRKIKSAKSALSYYK